MTHSDAGHTTAAEAAAGPPAHTYTLHEAAAGVYMITDGNYQNMFVTTSDGVVLVDAPMPLEDLIEPAIREVTSDPVTTVVYSHQHNDHIAGIAKLMTSDLLVPDVEIHAEASTARFLEAKQDPARPVPTHVFEGKTTLTRGGRTLELEPTRYHCVTGDLLVTMPQEKVLMAVDICTPDCTPLIDFDATQDMYGYMNTLDRFVEMDFDAFVAGHAGRLANKHDVQLTRDYVRDVYEAVRRAHVQFDDPTIYAEERWTEMVKVGKMLSDTWEHAAQEVLERWKDGPLLGVDLWVESHCRTMMFYVRYSD